jgi:hypothetical protein
MRFFGIKKNNTFRSHRMQRTRITYPKADQQRINRAEKRCDMRVKPGMSKYKYQKEFERVLDAVGKYRNLTYRDFHLQPAEQQSEVYHKWVELIRTAARIQRDAVGSDSDDD